MRYDCGDPTCAIRSGAGKNFERVIAYAMETLKTVFDLSGAQNIGLCVGASSEPALRAAALKKFLMFRESVDRKPFDQDLLESSWSALENALQYFREPEKLLFRVWVRPTESTLSEMAFCRVVDGWKFYMEELSGERYGKKRHNILQGEEIKLDEVLNETRNLFVHYDGVLGFNKRKKKKHADMFKTQLEDLIGSTSAIVDICRHAMGLVEGDRFVLGMRETVNYLDEVAQLLETIEVRHCPMA